ncbi:unnamed protein product, partial [Brassica oleracea var. botrytis]
FDDSPLLAWDKIQVHFWCKTPDILLAGEFVKFTSFSESVVCFIYISRIVIQIV